MSFCFIAKSEHLRGFEFGQKYDHFRPALQSHNKTKVNVLASSQCEWVNIITGRWVTVTRCHKPSCSYMTSACAAGHTSQKFEELIR